MADKKPFVNYSGDIKEIASTDTIPIANGGVNQTAWASWTPSWTNVTIGNADVIGRYIQIGKTVFASLDVTFGTTTTTNGSIQSFTLPVNARTRNIYTLLARGQAFTTAAFYVVAQYKSSSDSYLGFELSAGAGGLDNTVFTPVAWSNTHVLTLNFVYEAA